MTRAAGFCQLVAPVRGAEELSLCLCIFPAIGQKDESRPGAKWLTCSWFIYRVISRVQSAEARCLRTFRSPTVKEGTLESKLRVSCQQEEEGKWSEQYLQKLADTYVDLFLSSILT